MNGIFHLLLDVEWGEMDCAFRKRIEEYSEPTEDCSDSRGGTGGAYCGSDGRDVEAGDGAPELAQEEGRLEDSIEVAAVKCSLGAGTDPSENRSSCSGSFALKKTYHSCCLHIQHGMGLLAYYTGMLCCHTGLAEAGSGLLFVAIHDGY